MINDAGLALIKKYEGCKLTAYQDIRGIWTIGYGQTKNVKQGMVWTQAQAEEDLYQTISAVEKKVCGLLNLTEMIPTNNQVAALTSFTYNLGFVNLMRLLSSAAKTKSYYDTKTVALKMQDFDRAGGEPVPGLLARRLAEGKLYLTKDYLP